MSQVASAILGGLFGTLFIGREAKEQMLREYPALKRRHQAAWMTVNNATESVTQLPPDAIVILDNARAELWKSDEHRNWMDTELRKGAEKLMAEGRLTDAEWRSAGLAGVPVLLIGVAAIIVALAAILPAAYWVRNGLFAQSVSNAEGHMLRFREVMAAWRIQADNATKSGQPLPPPPRFPSDDKPTFGESLSKSLSGVGLAAVGLAALFLFARSRKGGA